MKTSDAVNRFGSQTALADKLGISKAADNAWGEEVPPLRQLQLQALTNGEMQADADVYEQLSKRHKPWLILQQLKRMPHQRSAMKKRSTHFKRRMEKVQQDVEWQQVLPRLLKS